MVIHHTRTIGLWVASLGLLVGVFGFLNLNMYVRDHGFFWNVQNQSVVFPFLHGENPLSCLADSFRRLIPNPTGVQYKPEPGCYDNTTAPFRAVVAVSVFLVILGIGLMAQKVKDADPWAVITKGEGGTTSSSFPGAVPPGAVSPPKNWKKPVSGGGGGGDEDVELQYDGPIKPHEGGF